MMLIKILKLKFRNLRTKFKIKNLLTKLFLKKKKKKEKKRNIIYIEYNFIAYVFL